MLIKRLKAWRLQSICDDDAVMCSEKVTWHFCVVSTILFLPGQRPGPHAVA